MRHSRQVRLLRDWVQPPTTQCNERRRDMANGMSSKSAAGQKPMVRIEYCTS